MQVFDRLFSKFFLQALQGPHGALMGSWVSLEQEAPLHEVLHERVKVPEVWA